MPKYLKAVAKKNNSCTNTNLGDFAKIHILSLFFFTKSETMCEALLWEIAA